MITKQQILSYVSAAILGKSDSISSALTPLTFATSTSWVFSTTSPNKSLIVTGNVTVSITSTSNGDAGVLKITKTTGNEVVTLAGTVFGTLLNNSLPQYISFLNDNGIIYWFAENAQISHTTQVVTSGSATVSNNVNLFVYNNTGTTASATITLPSSPVDGQSVDMYFINPVTALTIAANTGQTITQATIPTGTTANKRLGYNFISALSMWIAKQ